MAHPNQQHEADNNPPDPTGGTSNDPASAFSGASSLPFVDRSILLNPTAAAAIAAVAAAAQQMARGQPSAQPFANHGGSHGTHSPMPPQARTAPDPSMHQVNAATSVNALLSQLSNAQSSQVQPSASLPNNQAIAALLNSIGGQRLPFQASAPQAQSRMPSIPNSHSNLAAAQVVAAHSASGLPPGVPTNAMMANMHTWDLKQLEQHANLLRRMNQPIPQHVVLLLAEARRKEEKKTAKRVANRKSASDSRARKKKLVEEMTKTNARLKRQALILSLLPDLVIATTPEAEITFCSAQVERVLQYKIEDVVGRNLVDLLVPDSRNALLKLIKSLVVDEKSGGADGAKPEKGRKRRRQGQQKERKEGEGGNANGNGNASGQSSSGSGGESSETIVVVSDRSFPMSVVKVNSEPAPESGENENSNSDTSTGGKQQAVPSSLSNSLSRSPTASLMGNSGDDDGKQNTSGKQRNSSSDDSSSLSSDAAKKLRRANENLERNVRWHNEQKRLGKSKLAVPKNSHTDDVTGAYVTANNATARLSSLQHVPLPKKEDAEKEATYESTGEQSSSEDSLLAGVEEKKKKARKSSMENSSDDSGYRESNESPPEEDSSSSDGDSSNSNGRPKPLAPTCNICLIREDLTTLWCEVTSSIRTRSLDEDSDTAGISAVVASIGKPPTNPSVSAGNLSKPGVSSDEASKESVKELLLCLRPIRDGEEKVDETLSFLPKDEPQIAEENEGSPSGTASGVPGVVSQGTSSQGEVSKNSSLSSSGGATPTSAEAAPLVPSKKRPHSSEKKDEAKSTKKSRKSAKRKSGKPNSDNDKMSVVESLMLMSNDKK